MGRGRYVWPVVVVGAAAGAGAALLWTLPDMFGDALPDKIAVHWGPNGQADRWVPSSDLRGSGTVPWLVACAIALGIGLYGWPRRMLRGSMGAVLGGGLGFFGAIQYSTIAVNAGATDWRETSIPWWHVVLVLTALLLGGTFGYWAGSRGPDHRPEGAEPPETARIPLDRHERTVWIGYCHNRWIPWAGGVLTLSSMGPLVTEEDPDLSFVLMISGSLLFTALVLSALTSVRVLVDERGLQVRLGLPGLPAKRIPLDRVVSAYEAEFRPTQVGGWGYRITPDHTVLMLRGGPCLVVRQTGTGRDFVVSVDDADRGAALLNTLREHTPR
ncbi:DUF1648 domain-containing protein [Actinomadura sp. KC06]|uniref:DUF1648 domain-containing protein n=1 Tax=Actinomadura sp. KC06 TaxID=2530369 RepID=UPI00104CCA04|nr:DUF1648 domain-containing protein [Actinomadura sp. KC06]TDD34854.1 DUF1648 domain-containing protein [Actinomadura sp. KC06]